MFSLPILFIFSYMTVWFGIAWLKKDNSIVDVAWGLGFVLLTWLHLFLHVEVWSVSHYFLLLAVSVWGLRLSAHIGYRNYLKSGEDWRYAAWRNEWGKTVVWRSFLQVFMLQGFFMGIVMLPVLLCPSKTTLVAHPLIFLVRSVGFIVFLGGFLYETIADYQLLQFTKSIRVKGDILQTGLWKYSRHPNYFGEIIVWIGIFLIALPFTDLQETLVAALSPATMIWLLSRVSGVPMLERKLAENAAYKQYIEKTPALFPRFYT